MNVKKWSNIIRTSVRVSTNDEVVVDENRNLNLLGFGLELETG